MTHVYFNLLLPASMLYKSYLFFFRYYWINELFSNIHMVISRILSTFFEFLLIYIYLDGSVFDEWYDIDIDTHSHTTRHIYTDIHTCIHIHQCKHAGALTIVVVLGDIGNILLIYWEIHWEIWYYWAVYLTQTQHTHKINVVVLGMHWEMWYY